MGQVLGPMRGGSCIYQKELGDFQIVPHVSSQFKMPSSLQFVCFRDHGPPVMHAGFFG